MNGWDQPETWVNIDKMAASVLRGATKLKEVFSRKRIGRKREEKKVAEDIAELQKDLGKSPS